MNVDKLCFSGPRRMIKNAFEWAERTGNIRRNPVHQEQEARLVLDDTFFAHEEDGESQSRDLGYDVEEPSREMKLLDITCSHAYSVFRQLRTGVASSWRTSLCPVLGIAMRS